MFSKKSCLFIMSVVSIIAGSAFAQESGGSEALMDTISLEDLLNIKVVTASRREESSAMAPATIRVLTERDIKERGYKDLKDIFRDLPGFDVGENLSGEVRTLAMARGLLGANKLLVLKDGKRVNAITGERLVLGNNMPLFNVKRIEIMYGPGSVLYGADAYAGVVNMITSDFKDIAGGKANGGILDISGGMQSTYDVGLMGGTRIAENANATVSLRYYNSKGVDPTEYPEFDAYNSVFDYEQPVTDYELYTRIRLGEGQLTFYRQDAKEPGGPGTTPSSNGGDWFQFTEDYIWHQKQNKVYFDHTLGGSNWELVSTIGYEDYEIDPDTNFFYVAGFGGPAYKYGRNMAVFLEEKLDYKFNDNTSVVSGLTVERVDAFAKGNNLSAPWSRKDLSDEITYPNNAAIPAEYRNKTLNFGVRPYTSSGVFAEVKHRFSDNLLANVGARYDNNSDYDGVFTPRAGLVYKLSDKTTTKLLYGEAYIKPSRYLAYEHWSAGGAFGMYPNPELKPERLSTVQFNLSHSFSEKLVVGLNTYQNWVRDLITTIADGSGWNYNGNSGSFETRGAELLVDYLPTSSLRSYLYYTYLDAEQESGAPMNKTAENKLNAGLTYTWNKISFSPRVRWSDQVRYLDTASANGISEMDGFTIVDFSTRWSEVVANGDLYLTVRNLADEQYYHATPFGEGPEQWQMEKAPQPGRYAEVGFTYKF